MRNILIVDDDVIEQSLRNIYAGVISRKGYNPLTAANGQEALEIICQESVDLIILDLQMPVMDGKKVLIELKRRGLSIPVIMNSVDLPENVKRAVRESGYEHVKQYCDESTYWGDYLHLANSKLSN